MPALDALVLEAIDALHAPACRERALEEETGEKGQLADGIRKAIDQLGEAA